MTLIQIKLGERMHIRQIVLFIMYFFLFYAVSLSLSIAAPIEGSKISFWNHTKKGANVFNKEISRDEIKLAKHYGIQFIRLAPDKFVTSQRDFLVGNADNYTGLVLQDLDSLRQILDICSEENMPVVLTMLTLPGSRWKQHNQDKDDLRIWSQPKFLEQAAKFWQDLARELKNHPTIIAYNVLNEPHLERVWSATGEINSIDLPIVKSSLFNFYSKIIAAIRQVDQTTPIIIDSSAYADPKAFRNLSPISDKYILYSFHMYEPYAYTNYKTNQGQYSYPGKIQEQDWNKKVLQDYMQEVIVFQKKHNIPSSRILVGEFGGHRTSIGLDQYFKDLTDIFMDHGWHFAFYAFREDTWDGMDYELGNKKLPWSYWQAIEKGEKPRVNRSADSPQFRVLKKALSM